MATNGPSEVVIIGGGISGTTAAYELAKAGVRVTLLERGSLANMASSWTLAGVRQSGRLAPELPLARAAVEIWPTLNEELGADVEYRQRGNLRLARTMEEVERIQDVVEDTRTAGIPIEFLPDNATVRSVAPAIGENVIAASLCPTDGQANPTRTVSAFAAAAERLGATIRTGVSVESIVVESGRVTGVMTDSGPVPADAVAVVAGIHTPELIAPLGYDLPLEIVSTPAMLTIPMPRLLHQVLGVASADLAARQQVDGRIRATGGGKPWGLPLSEIADSYEKVQPTTTRIADAIARISNVFPAFAEARLERVWGGLIDSTPDAMPVYERLDGAEGLVVAAGFSGHGFGIGPITGRIVKDLIVSGRSELPIEPFNLNRLSEVSGHAPAELHG